MNMILWVFLALAFGLMAFLTIQEDLPPELSFLKGNGTGVVEQTPGQAQTVRQLEGWTITQQGPVLEATRKLSGELVVGGTTYDVPTFGVLCNAGKPDARFDTRMVTTGVKTTSVAIDGKPSEWAKGGANNVFPPNATEFVRYAAQQKTVALTFSYRDLGKQTVQLDASQLAQLLASFPQSCQ